MCEIIQADFSGRVMENVVVFVKVSYIFIVSTFILFLENYAKFFIHIFVVTLY